MITVFDKYLLYTRIKDMFNYDAEIIILSLFQHTFGTHPEQPLPTGYKAGILS